MPTKPTKTKRERELEKKLAYMCRSIDALTKLIDREMRGPSTAERGMKIAKWLNIVNIENDSIWRFTLGKKLPVK